MATIKVDQSYLKKYYKFRTFSLRILSFCLVSILFVSSNAFAGGVTIITHGYGANMGWVDDFGDKLVNRITTEYLQEGENDIAGVALYLLTYDDTGISIESVNGIEYGSTANTTGHAVIKINWIFWADKFGTDPPEGYDTGNVAKNLASKLHFWTNYQYFNFIASPIHLIGHSRGGSLVGAMARELGDYGYWVDQVTFLDPHPTENGMDADDWGEEDGMYVWDNVIFADNYYRCEPLSCGITGVEPGGEPVTGAYNVRLSENYLEGQGSTLFFRSYLSSHSDVHAWYRGTIPSELPPNLTLSLEAGAEFGITTEWYVADVYDDNVARPRYTIGYASSLTANGGAYRPYEGIHSGINGSGQLRNFNPTYPATAINNVGYLTLLSQNVTAGDTLEADYRYQSWTSNFGVEIYLDTNRNPHDGYKDTQMLGLDYHDVSDGMEKETITLSVPDDVSADTYYVFIKTTGFGGKRYFYAPRPLVVADGSQPVQGSETAKETATADAWFSKYNPTQGSGNTSTLELYTGAYESNGLLKFDLSSIPNGSAINTVELKLHVSSASGNNRQIAFYKVNGSWKEYDVTWNTKPAFGDLLLWQDVSDLGTLTIDEPALTNLVEDWVDGTETNYGIYLIAGNVDNTFSISTREASFSYRPKLIVNYTPPPPADLIITNLYPEPSPSYKQFIVGQSVDWKVTVKNIGLGPADASHVGCYLGTSLTDLSKSINSYSIPAIESDDSETDYDDYTFVTSDIGERYIICRADDGDDVDESKEGNNNRDYGPFIVAFEKVATPHISPDGGTFSAPQQITINSATTDAEIYYTIDGTNPTSNSALYSGFFTINSSSVVRARGYKSGFSESLPAKASFTINVAELSVTPSTQTVSADNETTSFDVANTGSGDMEWAASVISGESWLSITSGISGTNSGTITATFSANTSDISRTGTIRVTATGADGTDVTVVQSAPIILSPPTGVSASDGDSTSYVAVSWNSSTGATGYQLYRCTSSSTSSCGSAIYSGSSLSYNDTGATAGTTYYYRVNASNSDGTSEYSSYDPGYKAIFTFIPPEPTGVLASDGDTTSYVSVSWDSSSGATSYQLYRCTSSSTSSCGSAIYSGSSLSYNDTGATAETTYYYRVNASNSGGTSEYSSYDTGYKAIDLTQILSSYQIEAGFYYTCALDDNGVSCWGDNSNSQTTVPVLSNPIQISAGEIHTCAVDDNGMSCWGDNNFVQITTPALSNPNQISAGARHTCAVDDNGVSCWGSDFYGQITVPVLSNPIQVSTGYYHTCAVDDNGVNCWGHNNYSQTTVPVLSNPIQVSAGAHHNCVLDDYGVSCWGYNNYGQTTVSVLSNPMQVSAGTHHSCALDDYGVSCWGNNNYGQTTVPVLSNPIQISAGAHHTCALDDNGVSCWGYNNDGQTTVPEGLVFSSLVGPTVNIPAIPLVTEGSTISLNGSVNSNGNTIVSYLWEQTAGVTVNISNASQLNATVANVPVGSYTFQLTITDQLNRTAVGIVSVKVNAASVTQPQSSSRGGGSMGPMELLMTLLMTLVLAYRRKRL